MKIVKLEDFHADGGWDTYSFLKITTDEGIIGWSEFNESRRKGMTALIHGLVAELIGQDPCAIARIDAALYARSRPTAGGLTAHAIAAIESLPRYPRQGARRSRLRASWRRRA
jgi:L-alanine-DL-glutamate epimerase-like enolase superfamily enzyme